MQRQEKEPGRLPAGADMPERMEEAGAPGLAIRREAAELVMPKGSAAREDSAARTQAEVSKAAGDSAAREDSAARTQAEASKAAEGSAAREDSAVGTQAEASKAAEGSAAREDSAARAQAEASKAAGDSAARDVPGAGTLALREAAWAVAEAERLHAARKGEKMTQSDGEEEERLRALRDCKITAYYNSTGSKNPRCHKCNDRGFIYLNPNMVRPCECKAQRDAERMRAASGLSASQRGQTFASFAVKHAWQHTMKQRALAFCQEADQWFFAGGQVGCGKTHLCTAILNERMAGGKRARYMVWPDEADAIKGNAEGFLQTLEKLMEVPVLYIDDFLKSARERLPGQGGAYRKRPPTAGELNAAFKLINHRYNRPDRQTILSSEHTLADILEFDEGLGSRIYQRCKAYRLEIAPDEGKNLRLWE